MKPPTCSSWTSACQKSMALRSSARSRQTRSCERSPSSCSPPRTTPAKSNIVTPWGAAPTSSSRSITTNLPRRSSSSASSSRWCKCPKSAPDPSMSEGKPAATLLVVDDDRGLLRLTAKALERAGFSVATAASGAEAIAWLKENQPALLLLDLKLQDFDARQIISQLSDLKRLPSFLIITGQGDE